MRRHDSQCSYMYDMILTSMKIVRWPKLGAAPPVPLTMVDGGDSNDEYPLRRM